MAFYNQPPEAVLRDLGSSPAGLTEAEAQARLERDGKNLLQGKKRKSLLRAFLGSLCDRMTIVLFLAAAASYTASRIAGRARPHRAKRHQTAAVSAAAQIARSM